MSSTQHAISIARRQVKLLVDRAQINTVAPELYQKFVDALYAPQRSTPPHSVIQVLYQEAQDKSHSPTIARGRIMEVLRAWTNQEQPRTQAAYLQPASVGDGKVGFGQQLTRILHPTATIYKFDQQQSSPDQQTFTTDPFVMEGVGCLMSADTLSADYNLGRLISLHKASNADLPQAINNQLSIRNYCTGEFEKQRLITSEITLKLAQNSAADAAELTYRCAPREVVRGMFANVILYHELVYIPIGYKEFHSIAQPAWEAFNKENNWRATLEVLNTRSVGEWKIMSKALCRLLNDLIFRRIRADTPGMMLISIEDLQKLSEMDDRNAGSPVARHTKYWQTFNKIVGNAIDHLFNPENLIGPDDDNFGDFVKCSKVVFYAEGRSKYDYGTFAESVDRKAFIDKIMATNTVVRVPRTAILTNALDPRLVAQVSHFKPTEQLLFPGVNTVGTTLISKLDYLKRGDVQSLICLDQSDSKSQEIIRLGITLDDTLVLLNGA